LRISALALQTVPQYSGKSVSCNSHSTGLIFYVISVFFPSISVLFL
jgi:hypothetical protein